MSNDTDHDQPPAWVRLADLGEEAGVSPITLRRWAQRLPAEQAEKRPREAGGQAEWWVRADVAAEFLHPQDNDQTTIKQRSSNDQATIKQRSSNDHDNDQSNNPPAQSPPVALTLAHVETRLARIEGVVAGQWRAEWSERLQGLTEANERLCQEAQRREERYLQELTALREIVQRQEAQHAQELAAAREEAHRREEGARRREAALLERLASLQEELARPWWKRLWPGAK